MSLSGLLTIYYDKLYLQQGIFKIKLKWYIIINTIYDLKKFTIINLIIKLVWFI